MATHVISQGVQTMPRDNQHGNPIDPQYYQPSRNNKGIASQYLNDTAQNLTGNNSNAPNAAANKNPKQVQPNYTQQAYAQPNQQPGYVMPQQQQAYAQPVHPVQQAQQPTQQQAHAQQPVQQTQSQIHQQAAHQVPLTQSQIHQQAQQNQVQNHAQSQPPQTHVQFAPGASAPVSAPKQTGASFADKPNLMTPSHPETPSGLHRVNNRAAEPYIPQNQPANMVQQNFTSGPGTSGASVAVSNGTARAVNLLKNNEPSFSTLPKVPPQQAVGNHGAPMITNNPAIQPYTSTNTSIVSIQPHSPRKSPSEANAHKSYTQRNAQQTYAAPQVAQQNTYAPPQSQMQQQNGYQQNGYAPQQQQQNAYPQHLYAQPNQYAQQNQYGNQQGYGQNMYPQNMYPGAPQYQQQFVPNIYGPPQNFVPPHMQNIGYGPGGVAYAIPDIQVRQVEMPNQSTGTQQVYINPNMQNTRTVPMPETRMFYTQPPPPVAPKYKYVDQHGRPLTDEEVQTYESKIRATYRVKFGILRENYQKMEIPDFPDTTPIPTIEEMYSEYVKRIHVDTSVDQNKIYLLVLWLLIEIGMTRFFKIPLSGYTLNQFNYLNKYQLLLIELGESSYQATGQSSWPVEVRIVVMATFNAVIFILVKFLADKIGPDMADKLRESIGSVLTQNKAESVLKRAEQATADNVPPPPAEPKAPLADLGNVGNIIAQMASLFSGGLGGASAEKPKVEPQVRKPTTIGGRNRGKPAAAVV